LLDSGEIDAYVEGGATFDGPIVINDGAIPGDGTVPGDGGSPEAGDAAEASAPPPFPSPTLAAGLGFGCHIDTKGAVWCWGDNQFGQAGRQPQSNDDGGAQQVQIPSSGDAGLVATALAVGDDYACAVTSQKTVYCWGRNDQNQLDHPTQGGQTCTSGQNYPCSWTPMQTTNTTPAVTIAAAGARTCIVGSDGSVQCWGGVQDGGTATGPGTTSGLTQLSVAADHACALVPAAAAADGGAAGTQVECWGANGEQQVTASWCDLYVCQTPVVAPVSNPTGMAAGAAFTCAIPAAGGVVCFGDNTAGELGHAPNSSGDQPLDGGLTFNGTASAVTGLSNVSALIASGNDRAACALGSGGAVACWGNVQDGGAGTPAAVAGLPSMSALGTADGTYVCGAATDGGIWCWSLDAGASAPTQVQ
jgi:alpha-tubulin suppressor-like RCC1 family protein